MADGTKIEWSEATWNPITGCSLASPGCTNCYAMDLAGTRLADHPSRKGLTQPSKAGPVWTGEVRFNEQWLDQPLRWKKPRMIFVCAHGDLFHEKVPDEWIDRVFAVMALCPQHTFQVLTKRSARMRAWFDRYDGAHDHNCADIVADAVAVRRGHLKARGGERAPGMEWPLPNVWLGVSVEDQQRRDRIIDLAQTPAAVRWISGEPLLERLSLTDIPLNGGEDEHGIQWMFNALTGEQYFLSRGYRHSGDGPDMQPLDWVVVGGESGRGARPMHPDWARSLRDQCAAAGRAATIPNRRKEPMGTTAHPTLAETMRRLGPIVNVSLQPFSGHYTGELWNVSVNHHTMGQGETLEMALADLAAQLAKQGN